MTAPRETLSEHMRRVSSGIARWRVLILGALVLQLFASCDHRSAGGSPMLLERLYFGMSTPQGVVSDAAFSRFVRDVVTPRFPDGLTELPGRGQWRNAQGAIISEATTVLEIAMPDAPENHQRIRDIISSYKRQFSQESVMLSQQPAQVTF